MVRETLLAWLIADEHPMSEELRAVVVAELPRSMARLRASYAPFQHDETSRAGLGSAIPPEDRAWGSMPASLYRAAVDTGARP